MDIICRDSLSTMLKAGSIVLCRLLSPDLTTKDMTKSRDSLKDPSVATRSVSV